jgi:hypothetical protein
MRSIACFYYDWGRALLENLAYRQQPRDAIVSSS